MKKVKKVKEFQYQGGSCVEVIRESRPHMLIHFVRGDGNKADYEKLL